MTTEELVFANIYEAASKGYRYTSVPLASDAKEVLEALVTTIQ